MLLQDVVQEVMWDGFVHFVKPTDQGSTWFSCRNLEEEVSFLSDEESDSYY